MINPFIPSSYRKWCALLLTIYYFVIIINCYLIFLTYKVCNLLKIMIKKIVVMNILIKISYQDRHCSTAAIKSKIILEKLVYFSMCSRFYSESGHLVSSGEYGRLKPASIRFSTNKMSLRASTNHHIPPRHTYPTEFIMHVEYLLYIILQYKIGTFTRPKLFW